MEYQKNVLERRHTEVHTWFRNFRTDDLKDWFYCCVYAWLWVMLVQLLHLIPKRFLTFSQRAPEWTFGVWGKLRTHHVALLALVSNLKEDQSAVVLVVHQTLEAVSAVHCQERNEINNHRKDRDCHSRKFLPSSLLYSHSSLLQEFSVNRQRLRPHF